MVVMTSSFNENKEGELVGVHKKEINGYRCKETCMKDKGLIRTYIIYSRMGCVETLNEEVLGYMLKSNKQGLIVFQNSDDFLISQVVVESCDYIRLQGLIMAVADEKNKFGNKLFRYLEIEDRPKAVIVDSTKSDSLARMDKHLLSHKINKHSLQLFAHDYINGRLNRVYLSAPIPTTPYIHGVRELVADNFKQVVYQDMQYTLLFIYVATNNLCKILAEQYIKLAQYLKPFSGK